MKQIFTNILIKIRHFFGFFYIPLFIFFLYVIYERFKNFGQIQPLFEIKIQDADPFAMKILIIYLLFLLFFYPIYIANIKPERSVLDEYKKFFLNIICSVKLIIEIALSAWVGLMLLDVTYDTSITAVANILLVLTVIVFFNLFSSIFMNTLRKGLRIK